jgi:SEC-C motif
MAKNPVNAPCPCGSGKKYKKCCRDEATLTATITDDIRQGALHAATAAREHTERRKRHIGSFGHVRPLVHADFKGNKIVAVGASIYASPEWKTMTDFLGDYIKVLLGREWWLTEAKQPREDAHPILSLARLAWDFMHSHGQRAGELFTTTPDSATFEYLAVAYDLYVLRHHLAIQGTLLKRLRLHDQFKGARHEIFAAATMVRANCELTFFKERASKVKRPEFLARHRETSETAVVEAKARHRRDDNLAPETFGLRSLLADAFAKETAGHPLVVFTDLDLPPGYSYDQLDFAQRMGDDIDHAKGVSQGGLDPFALLVTTNHRVVAGSPPDYNGYDVVPAASVRPISTRFRDAIRLAVAQRRNLPSHFDPQ